jgi:Tol biopolymer transport system component
MVVLCAGAHLHTQPARAEANGIAPEVSSAPVLYFVHLGDIWRFDAQTGAASIYQIAGGSCAGHVSWSADGRTVAWETRVGAQGRARSSVVIRRPPLTPSGPTRLLTFPDAASPAVSPDGRYLLYEANDTGRMSLMCVDLDGASVTPVLQGARNGAWQSVDEASGDRRLQVAFDLPDEEPSRRASGCWTSPTAMRP